MGNMIACTGPGTELSGVPEEIKILPLGKVHSQKGDFYVDEESFELILKKFRDRKLDLVIDYEHQTLKDVQAPAGGWIKDIQKGEDALIAKVEWTPKGKEYVQNKEYRYLSPVVMVRESDGKVVSVHSVALTNTPAIDGMFAIVNSADFPAGEIEIEIPKGGKIMEFLKALAAMLGLPETATEEEVKNAVLELQKKQDDDKEELVANSTILTMLDLKEDAKTEDVTGKIQQLKNGGSEELKALKAKIEKKEADEAVALALKEGKISAAQKEWASAYALKDPEGFASFCEKTAATVPMGKLNSKEHDSTRKPEADMMVLKNLGLTKEEFEKYRDKEE